MPGQHHRDGSGSFEGELNILNEEQQANADQRTQRTKITGQGIRDLDKSYKATQKKGK